MRYIASPFGFVIGKWGDVIGEKWKNKFYTRKRTMPTQRGTLAQYTLLKKGLLTPDLFSFKQFNIRRLVIQVLGYLGKMNMENLIFPVWDQYRKKHKKPLSGMNLFMKANVKRLFFSMPHTDQEFDETTNSPDLTQLLISNGELESTPITSATYAPDTGYLTLHWSNVCYKNGNQTDIPYAAVLKKPILESYGYPDGTWQPALYLYGPMLPKDQETLNLSRHSESAIFTLPPGLTATDLTAFLFFRSDDNTLISNSTALQVS
jgi:hypothetical protein